MEISEKMVVEQTSTEKIKLIKNTKGYNWEIQVLSLDIDKMVQLNNRMLQEFGNGE